MLEWLASWVAELAGWRRRYWIATLVLAVAAGIVVGLIER
jgi:hypothetical protein